MGTPKGVLRNAIIRFETVPRTFSLRPAGRKDFSDFFRTYESGAAHQIGACVVEGDPVRECRGRLEPSASQDRSLVG